MQRIPMLALAAAAVLAAPFIAAQVTPPIATAQSTDTQPTAPQSTAPQSDAPRSAAPESFHSLVQENVDAVVLITTNQDVAPSPGMQLPPGLERFLERFGEEGLLDRFQEQEPAVPQQSLGSGFVIGEEGYIVTNTHVVETATEIFVTLHDGRELTAELVGTDKQTDLAVIKVETEEPLPVIQWGDSDDALVGDWVIAIGSPFGLGSTVTAGIISARARDIQAGPYDDFIQTDAPINRGNSGGPLIDLDGEVIGVNTAIFSPSGNNIGIGFAIPSNVARPVIEQLRETGTVRRGWLGVQIQQMNEDLASALGMDAPRGALVSSVIEGGPAQEAGVQVGDVIIEFNDAEIQDFRDLPRVVADAAIGEVARMTVLRDGEQTTLEPRIALMQPQDDQLAAQEQQPAEPQAEENGGAALGLQLSELTAQERNALGMNPDEPGVVVSDVTPDSVAAEAGLQAGDVIMRIDGSEVNTPAEAKQSLEAAREADRNAVAVLLRRGERQSFVAMPLNRRTG